MEKRSVGSLLVGTWNTKTIVTVAIGAALFGVLMVYASFPIFANTYVTAAMLIPVIVGAMFGPVAAMVAAGVGNIVADLIGGWGVWFDWSVGNALAGFFVGLLAVYGARITDGYFKVKHAIIYALVVIVSQFVIYVAIVPILSFVFYGGELNFALLQGSFAALGNSIVLIVIGLPLLFGMSARFAARTNIKEEKSGAY
jgi:energy-coupling factor transport system substrate-specific component